MSAHLLSQQHDVQLFEASDRLGGHTNTVEVNEHGRKIAVDTGFIVFNEPNYPSFCGLLGELGVESRESDMSFSVHCERSGLEYNGRDLNTLFVQRRNLINPRHWRMLASIVRFNRIAPVDLSNGLSDSITVKEYTASNHFDEAFINNYLVPLGASLWSCSADRFLAFPIRFVLEFLHNHSMLQVDGRPIWRTVKGGSWSYVKALAARLDHRIRLGSAVSRVERSTRGATVRLASGESQDFDEVVLACHADDSLRLVATPDAFERAVLEHFPYQPNLAVLHTDEGVLPARRNAWASWNYRIPEDPSDQVCVTYNMNILQGLDAAKTYCVTLNPTVAIDESSVITRIRYHHPVFVPGRASAQDKHPDMIRRRGISYCGAYWGYGFHEDGVRSALAVSEAFDQAQAA